MPDWVIWVAIGVLFMSWRRSRACCGVGAKRIHGQRDRTRDRMTDGGMAANPQPRSRNGALKATPSETPLEALQRKFVSGPMTLEQYEAELDKLERLQ
jgi:hypothetical protein